MSFMQILYESNTCILRIAITVIHKTFSVRLTLSKTLPKIYSSKVGLKTD